MVPMYLRNEFALLARLDELRKAVVECAAVDQGAHLDKAVEEYANGRGRFMAAAAANPAYRMGVDLGRPGGDESMLAFIRDGKLMGFAKILNTHNAGPGDTYNVTLTVNVEGDLQLDGELNALDATVLRAILEGKKPGSAEYKAPPPGTDYCMRPSAFDTVPPPAPPMAPPIPGHAPPPPAAPSPGPFPLPPGLTPTEHARAYVVREARLRPSDTVAVNIVPAECEVDVQKPLEILEANGTLTAVVWERLERNGGALVAHVRRENGRFGPTGQYRIFAVKTGRQTCVPRGELAGFLRNRT